MTYDDLLDQAQKIPVRYQPVSKYLPNSVDPTDYYVSPPEKGGVRIGGCVVEKEIDDKMREVLDQGQGHFRTKADYVRAAIYYFTFMVVLPNTEGSQRMYRALYSRHRRHAALLDTEQDAKMIRMSEQDYAKAVELGRDDIQGDIMSDLRRYQGSIVDEYRAANFRAKIDDSPMGKRYLSHLLALAAQDAAEHVPQHPEMELEVTEGLQAIAEGEAGR